MSGTWYEGLAEDYRRGMSLRECAAKYEIAVETARRNLLEEGVKMRPIGKHMKNAGPEGRKLYAQGSCKGCGVAMMAWAPEERDYCGECVP